MLDFKSPTIEDKKWADECFKYAKSMNCEYCFGSIFLWATAYSTKLCHYKDFLICRWGKGKDIKYCVPIGNGDFKEAVNAIIEDSENLGINLEFYGITPYYQELLEEYFPNKFTYKFNDDFSDYIYLVEKMADLSGKKYHGKRNHITFFKKNYPDWKFEKIDDSNIDECIKLHTEWINNKNTDEEEDYSFEFEAVLSAFDNYKELCLIGGLIRVDSKVIAYTLGEELNEKTFVTHFEKAPAQMRGAYPIINREFTVNCLMDYEYVNREEDLGIEGLRKAKQSYYPEILLKKCIAVYEG